MIGVELHFYLPLESEHSIFSSCGCIVCYIFCQIYTILSNAAMEHYPGLNAYKRLDETGNACYSYLIYTVCI